MKLQLEVMAHAVLIKIMNNYQINAYFVEKKQKKLFIGENHTKKDQNIDLFLIKLIITL